MPGAIRRWLPRLCCGALAATLPGAPAHADTVWQRGGWSLDVTATVRELATAGHGTDLDAFAARAAATLPSLVCVQAATFPDCPAFAEVGDREVWTSTTRLRTRLRLRAGRHVAATVAYDHLLQAGILRTLEAGLGGALSEDALLDLDRDIHVLGLREDDPHLRWTHRLYRAFVEVRAGELEASVGRQRVAWSVGRLWQPLDRLNPIPPLALEADESPGVDAALLRWRAGRLALVEAVAAPARDPDDSAFAVRARASWRELDASAMAGIFDRAPTVGAAIAANWGESAVRAELVWAWPRREAWRLGAAAPREPDPFAQLLLSADRRFDVGNGVYALVEHLYNGNALGFGRGRAGPLAALLEATDRPDEALFPIPAAAAALGPFPRAPTRALLGGSRVVSGARHQTGLELETELTPAWRLGLLTLVDWNGGSAAWVPRLRYTGFAWMDLVVGVQAFAGPRHSEYGSAEHLAFVLADFFF